MSERYDDSVSNRSLLDRAMIEKMENDLERKALKEYKRILQQIDSDQMRLGEIKKQIRDISETTDNASVNELLKNGLQNSAKEIVARVNMNDRKLIELEQKDPLNAVLKREKEKAYKFAEQQGREALARYREEARKKQELLSERYRVSRNKETTTEGTKSPMKIDTKEKPSFSKQTKHFIVCLSVLCLIAVVISLISAVKIDFAVDHYDITKDRGVGYGCYKYECEYCRGRSRAKELSEFAYYRNLIFARNISVVVAVVSGVSTLGLGVFIMKNKKDGCGVR